jgi:hypothetical protein
VSRWQFFHGVNALKSCGVEQLPEVWLEGAAPFRLQSALYRWDAKWNYWTAIQRLLVQRVFQGWKEGDPAQGEVRLKTS